VEEALVCELYGECSLVVECYVEMGRIEFRQQSQDRIEQVHIFRIDNYSGFPHKPEEMIPR